MSMDTKVHNPDSFGIWGGPNLTSEITYNENKIKGTSWFHYTYTCQDGQMKSYLNGVLQNTTDAIEFINIANASGNLLIGYDGQYFMNGAMDELKIFNKCLSETEVENEAKRKDSISLGKKTADKLADISAGKSISISAILLKDIDKDKNIEIKLSNKIFTLKSSNTKIFKVTPEGKLTGVKAGKAKLTIFYGPHSVTYNLVVK